MHPLLNRWLLATAASVCAAAQAQVYVSSEDEHQVLVLDAEARTTARIAVCQSPRDMAFNPARTELWVACADSRQLGVIDLAQQKMSRTVPASHEPDRLALSPDGRTAYLPLEDARALAALDLANGHELFTVALRGEPSDVLVTPDGQSAYVSSESAHVVYRVDLDRRAVTHSIRVGREPGHLALHPNGKELWVSNAGEASLTVVDTESHAVKATVTLQVPGQRRRAVTPQELVFSPDGQSAWVALGDARAVARIGVASRQQETLVPMGKNASGLALDRSGSRMYVTHSDTNELTAVDTARAQALGSAPVGREPHSVRVRQ